MELTLIEVLQSQRRQDGAWLIRFGCLDGREVELTMTLKCAGEVKLLLWED